MNQRHVSVLGQSRTLALIGALLAMIALAWLPVAHADTLGCTTITSLPTVISAAGHYCLNKDFVQDFGTSVAFEITADNVVLDCNDHLVRNSNPAADTYGLYADNDPDRITVRNCTFDGFTGGMYFLPSNPNGVRNILLQDNLIVHARIIGIDINGSGSGNVIERNRVTELLGNLPGNPTGIRINCFDTAGSGNIIRDNVIDNFKPTPPSGTPYTIGIDLIGTQDAQVSGNTISGLYATTGGGVYGIVSSSATGTSVTGNVITSPPNPAAAPFDGGNYAGIFLQGTSAQQATNICTDNQVGHFNGDISGCVVAGNTGF
jgi:hypothetical protein